MLSNPSQEMLHLSSPFQWDLIMMHWPSDRMFHFVSNSSHSNVQCAKNTWSTDWSSATKSLSMEGFSWPAAQYILTECILNISCENEQGALHRDGLRTCGPHNVQTYTVSTLTRCTYGQAAIKNYCNIWVLYQYLNFHTTPWSFIQPSDLVLTSHRPCRVLNLLPM